MGWKIGNWELGAGLIPNLFNVAIGNLQSEDQLNENLANIQSTIDRRQRRIAKLEGRMKGDGGFWDRSRQRRIDRIKGRIAGDHLDKAKLNAVQALKSGIGTVLKEIKSFFIDKPANENKSTALLKTLAIPALIMAPRLIKQWQRGRDQDEEKEVTRRNSQMKAISVTHQSQNDTKIQAIKSEKIKQFKDIDLKMEQAKIVAKLTPVPEPKLESSSRVTEVFSKSDTSEGKLDAILTALNQQSAIQNDTKKATLQLFRLENEKLINESEKAKALYNSLDSLKSSIGTENSKMMRATISEEGEKQRSLLEKLKESTSNISASKIKKMAIIGGSVFAIYKLVEALVKKGDEIKSWLATNLERPYKMIGNAIGEVLKAFQIILDRGQKPEEKVESPTPTSTKDNVINNYGWNIHDNNHYMYKPPTVNPVPTYKDGTKGSHPGGTAIVGDGGKSEVILTPDKKAYITPNVPTVVDLPKGSQVIPSTEPMKFSDMKRVPTYNKGTMTYDPFLGTFTKTPTKSHVDNSKPVWDPTIDGFHNAPKAPKSPEVPKSTDKSTFTPTDDVVWYPGVSDTLSRYTTIEKTGGPMLKQYDPVESVIPSPIKLRAYDQRVLYTDQWLQKNTNFDQNQRAGIIGVLTAESQLNPKAENQWEKNKHMKTKKGTHNYGRGIAQWSNDRIDDFMEWYKSKYGEQKDIVDMGLPAQLEFMLKEMMDRPAFMKAMKGARSVQESTDVMLRGFENGSSNALATESQIDKIYGKFGYPYNKSMAVRLKYSNDVNNILNENPDITSNPEWKPEPEEPILSGEIQGGSSVKTGIKADSPELARLKEIWGEDIGNFIDNVVTNLDESNALKVLDDIVDRGIGGNIDALKTQMNEFTSKVSEGTKEFTQKVKTKTGEVIDSTKDFLSELPDRMANSKTIEVMDGIADRSLRENLNWAKDGLSNIGNALGDKASELTDKAIAKVDSHFNAPSSTHSKVTSDTKPVSPTSTKDKVSHEEVKVAPTDTASKPTSNNVTDNSVTNYNGGNTNITNNNYTYLTSDQSLNAELT